MKFRGEYWFLSNFYPCCIEISGYKFNCVEAAFQAAKCKYKEDKKKFEGLDGLESKRLGRKVVMREDWNDVKIVLMKRILRIKFSDEELMEKLKNIEGEIIEENTWNDKFWGVCNGDGRNELGKLLMEIRG